MPIVFINLSSVSLQLVVKELDFVARKIGHEGHKRLESIEGMYGRSCYVHTNHGQYSYPSCVDVFKQFAQVGGNQLKAFR